MSYCVQCGVELAPSEGKCPLCQTIVINPVEPYDPRQKSHYPKRTEEQTMTINKKYYAYFMALILLLPAVVCLLLDFVINGTITWSPIPGGALVMLFVSIAVPIVAGKHRVYFSITADGIALCMYLKLVEVWTKSGIWFSSIVFPVLVITTVLMLAIVASKRQRLIKGFVFYAVIMTVISLPVILLDLLISSYMLDSLTLSWSPYVAIPCLMVAVMLFLIHANKGLRSELHRRFHL